MNHFLPDTLPAGWKLTRLSSIATHHSGNSKLIKGRLSPESGVGLFPAFSASGQDVWRDGYEAEGDAIIVSAVGARCGKCFLASGKWSAIANTHVIWPKSELIDLKFLWYHINDENFWIRSGSAQPFVVVKKTFERPFALPPLDKQRCIVAEIEKQFTRLDAGVAALKRTQANLNRYRAAVLKAACEGSLVPTEAELARQEGRNYETGEQLLTRILEERRKKRQGRGKYKEPAAPDTTNLQTLPEGWVWATVGQLSTVVQYGSSSKTNKDSAGVPVLRMGNIEDGRLVLDSMKYLPMKHNEFPDLLLSKGDLLFNRTNSAELVGKTAVYKGTPQPCSFASYLIRLRLADGCPPNFVCNFINSTFGRAWIGQVVSQQVGQANVNGTKLQALSIPLPPLAEQERIVAEVDRRLSVVEELDTVVSANLQRTSRLRQSVLQNAFSEPLSVKDSSLIEADGP